MKEDRYSRDAMQDARRRTGRSRPISGGGIDLDCLIGSALFAAGIGLLYGAYLGIANADKIKDGNAIVVCISGVTFIGCALFFIRKKYLICYGVFEVITAIVIASFTIFKATNMQPSATFDALMHQSDALVTLIGLFSSVYIVVRGLDNIEKGILEKRKRRKEKNESILHA